MKDKKKLGFLAVVAVLVIVGGVVFATQGSKSTTKTNSSNSSSSAAPAADTSNAVATMAVTIKDFMFNPGVIKVKVGDTVTWTNSDSVHHNVVADNASADAPNGPLLANGESYSFKFTKAGTYTYHCAPHPYMHGTVIVE